MDKKELLQKHDTVCEGYIKLINDKDLMLKWTRVQLEALYLSKIGYLQIEKLKAELKAKSLKRQLEMARAAVNKNQTPDFDGIENEVFAQYIEVQMQIMLKTDELGKAKSFLINLVSPEQKINIHKIFRRLAKSLHPDVNPDFSATRKEIWHKVLKAYESGNAEYLKSLEIVYADEIKKVEDSKSELSEEELTLQIEMLTEGIKLLEKEIEELNNTFPFDIRDKINNEEWIKEQQTLLNSEIDTLQAYILQLESDYQNLKKAYE